MLNILIWKIFLYGKYSCIVCDDDDDDDSLITRRP